MNLPVRAGLSGVAAAAVAVGVAEVVAVLTGPLSAPLLAVGGVVVDHVPAPVKNFGVDVFGVHDKTALITGTAILLAAYAFGLGVVALRSWRLALGGIGLFAVVGVAAAVTRHDAGVAAALPTLIGAALAVPLLRFLLGRAGAPPAPLTARLMPGTGPQAGTDRPAALGATSHPGGAHPGGVNEPPAVAGAASRPGGADERAAVASRPSGVEKRSAPGAVASRPGGAVERPASVGMGARLGGATESDAGRVDSVGGAVRSPWDGAQAPAGAGAGVSGQVGPAGADGLGHDAAGTDEAGARQNSYLRVRKGSEPQRTRDLDEAGRRRFLKAIGLSAVVAAVSGVAGRLLTDRQAVTKARDDVVLPAARQSPPALPVGVQADGAAPFVSSNDDFYRIDTALYPPQVDPRTWELRIHGMVRNPITITWEQLLQRPMIERYVTLACVSNEVGGDLIGNALWLGTPIKELLDLADPLPGADQVVQRSVDGWTCGSPTSVLRDGRDALLAVGMNGQPLPVDHGFPVRMVVPGLYGYVSACKWITEIELTRFGDFDAYWVPRGWSQQAPIKTESRIDTPRDGASRSAGEVVVAGVAWAQHRGISKVEVQVDDGSWQEATLADTVSADTWRQWSYRWAATAGSHVLRVRATDRDGQTQTSTPAPPAPDGATGWHSVKIKIH